MSKLCRLSSTSIALALLVASAPAQVVLTRLVRSGDAAPAPAPAGAIFSANAVFQCSPAIDSLGRVAFKGLIDNAPGAARNGVWMHDGALLEIATSGNAAPGAAKRFTAFGNPSIADTLGGPTITFRAYLEGARFPSGVWSANPGVVLAAQTGDVIDGAAPLPILGFFGESLQRYAWYPGGGTIADSDETPIVAFDGTTFFSVRCRAPVTDNYALEGCGPGGLLTAYARKGGVYVIGGAVRRITWLSQPAALSDTFAATGLPMAAVRAVTRDVITNSRKEAILPILQVAGLSLTPFDIVTGDPAPGAAANVTFGSLGDPDASTDGWITFRASLSGAVTSADDAGLWRVDPAGNITLALRKGDAAPGTVGATFWFVNGDPLVNGAGEIAFRGYVRGGDTVVGTNESALWLSAPAAAPQLIARSGSAAPGAPGCTFGGFEGLALNTRAGGSQVVFSARLRGAATVQEEMGIWMTPAGGGAPQLVARRGFQLGNLGVVTDLKLATGSGGRDGRRSGLSDNGDAVFFARFANGSWAIVKARI